MGLVLYSSESRPASKGAYAVIVDVAHLAATYLHKRSLRAGQSARKPVKRTVPSLLRPEW